MGRGGGQEAILEGHLFQGAQVGELTAGQRLKGTLWRREKHLHAQWVKSGLEQQTANAPEGLKWCLDLELAPLRSDQCNAGLP